MDPQNNQGQQNSGVNPPQGSQPVPPKGQTPPPQGPPQGGQPIPPAGAQQGPPPGAYPPGAYPPDPNMYAAGYNPYYQPYPPQGGYPPQGAYPQGYPPAPGAPQTPVAPTPGAYPPGAYPPPPPGMGAGGMSGAGMPPATPEDTTPANFQLGTKLPAKLSVKVPAHNLAFDGDYFIRLLAGSISLSKDEKKRIIESIPKLKQSQIDELIRIFEEEKQKFAALSKKHVAQLEKLAEQHYKEWMDLESEFYQDNKKKEDTSKADEIRKNLGL